MSTSTGFHNRRRCGAGACSYLLIAAFALAAAVSAEMPRRVVDILHVKLQLSFDYEKQTVFGVCDTTFTPLASGASEFRLDCEDLTIRSIVDEKGARLPFRQTEKDLFITLNHSCSKKHTHTVSIKYDGRPQLGMYFTGPSQEYPHRSPQIWTQGETTWNHHWFPCFDFPNERATTETLITVPQSWFALSNGRLVSVKENKKAQTKTFHYKMNIPHVMYLNSVAAGEYAGKKVDWNGISVEWYVAPEYKDWGETAFGELPKILDFFNNTTGLRYPYEKAAQITIRDFMWGGMENITAVHQTDRTLHPPHLEPETSSVGLVAHEFAHQWFGDYVTCRDWNHIWINEGFATFFEGLYDGFKNGDEQLQWRMLSNCETLADRQSGTDKRNIVPPDYPEALNLFDNLAYPGGAATLHMLRCLVGDEAFFAGIKHFLEKWGQSSVDTADFRRAMEDTSGWDLAFFFQQWHFRPQVPRFKVTYNYDSNAREVVLKVEQTQEIDAQNPPYRLFAQVALGFPSKLERSRHWIQNKEEIIRIPASSEPLFVRFDERGDIAKKLDFPRSKQMMLAQLSLDASVMGRLEALRWAAEQHDSADVLPAALEFWRHCTFVPLRQEALNTLAKLGGEDAKASFLADTTHPNARVRQTAIDKLADLYRDDLTVQALLKNSAQADKHDEVRATALRAFLRTNAADKFDFCMAMTQHKSHQQMVANAALDGLSSLKDERARSVFLKMAGYGADTWSRETAMRCLGNLGESSPEDETVFNLMMSLTDHNIWWVKRTAIEILGQLKNPKAMPKLEKLATQDPFNRIRDAARAALAQMPKE